MADWRFYAQRPVSGLWLDNDVQFANIQLTKSLSTFNSGQATLAVPEYEPVATDGREVWGRWDTLLYAERDGILDSVYIVDSVQPSATGPQLKLVGAAAWLARVDYTSAYQVWQTNTFDVVRHLLDHANSKPRGLTWAYSSGSSATTVGDPEPPPKPRKPPRHKGEKKSAYEASTRYTTWQTDMTNWNNAYGDNAKYKVVYWESPYVLDEINQLVTDTGFDWRETYRWVSGVFDPEFKIEFADNFTYTRTDIKVVDGVNVVGRLLPSDDDESYANHVTMLGAGQGRKMRRSQANYDDGRLYSARFAHSKHTKNLGVLHNKATAAVKRTRRLQPQLGTVNLYDVDGFQDVAVIAPGNILTVQSSYTRPRINMTARVKSITEFPLNPGTIQIEFETQSA